MEKVREYKYDNLKFFLIFLVVLGHLLELINFENINKIIYLFHMPMFIYISGYFSKCDKKSIIKKLYIYIIWQTIYYFVYRFILGQDEQFGFIRRPIWILWYIYALIIWEFVIFIVPFKKIISKKPLVIVGFAFALSLICGFINQIGYDYCLSRIITFFPFFLLGYFQKKYEHNILEFNKNQKIKLFIYILMTISAVIYFVLNISKANIRCFYGAFSYNNMGYNIWFKLMWIMLSISIIFLLNNIAPNKKIKCISKVGSNTLSIYLIHGIIVRMIEKYGCVIFGDNIIINLVICIIIATVLLLILGNDYVSKCLTFLFDLKGIKNEKSINQ